MKTEMQKKLDEAFKLKTNDDHFLIYYIDDETKFGKTASHLSFSETHAIVSRLVMGELESSNMTIGDFVIALTDGIKGIIRFKNPELSEDEIEKKFADEIKLTATLNQIERVVEGFNKKRNSKNNHTIQ